MLLVILLYLYSCICAVSLIHLSDNDRHVIHDGNSEIVVSESVSKLYSKLVSSVALIDVEVKGINDYWDTNNFPLVFSKFDSNSLSKNVLAAKMIDRILDDASQSPKFTFSFTGSSVTAGRDCMPNESYPSVIERSLSPIFASLGISLEIRNIAMSNNPCIPYSACSVQWSGSNVDVFGWELGMNCMTFQTEGMATTIYHASRTNTRPLFISAFKSKQLMIKSTDPVFQVDQYYIANYSDSRNFSKPHLNQDGKCCGHKPWHPSPYGHLLIGHEITIGLLSIIRPTLISLQTYIHKHLKLPAFKEINYFLNSSLSDGLQAYDDAVGRIKCPAKDYKYIENIGYCQPSLVCHMSTLSYTDKSLLKLIDGLNVNLTLTDQLMNHYSKISLPISSKSSWRLHIFDDSEGTKVLPLDFVADNRWVVSGNEGPVSFIFDTINVGPIGLCQAPPAASQIYQPGWDYLERGPIIYLDDAVVNFQDVYDMPIQMMKRRCIKISNETEIGTHNVTIFATGLFVDVEIITHA